ncbi:ArsR family transcriptional regulator [Rhizobium sp. KAs_5_22]|uniref:ArsR/SmtB family transcription factor n=1 Tax=Ciceribacter selenitireducens TaxID=448181 RepID=UPI00048C21AA|nr:metalloregulator ArsR/SmtB family transcription factor [Ciceribacter selenitireducens]PPJ44691.1 ArsR family transcriptional regulator [Rhizobium sp. KAs_5_22]
MNTARMSDHCAVAAGLLSAAANPKRLLILRSLIEREYSVGELATHVGLSQSALSQHLSKLRGRQLVEGRREAQTIYYSSSSPSVKLLLAALDELGPNFGRGSVATKGKSL